VVVQRRCFFSTIEGEDPLFLSEGRHRSFMIDGILSLKIIINVGTEKKNPPFPGIR